MLVFTAVNPQGETSQFGVGLGNLPVMGEHLVETIKSIVEAAEREKGGPLKITAVEIKDRDDAALRRAVAEERKAAAFERIAADVRALGDKAGPVFDILLDEFQKDRQGRP